MLHINIVCIGKVKESFFKDAINEYAKRLSKFCILNFIELPDKPLPNNLNDTLSQQIIDAESKQIMNKISPSSYNIAMDSHGQSFSSEEFAKFINDLQQTNSEISFIIGGSLGLSSSLKSICSKQISFSKMTFPHQLIRVFLLEQLFRAFKINNNEKYHHWYIYIVERSKSLQGGLLLISKIFI